MKVQDKQMRILSVLVLCGVTGCAQHHAITGSIIDRNGEPIESVIVSVAPGDVEILSDERGGFVVDYLRDESGERVKLLRRTDYEVSAFKAGYHEAKTRFYFKRGELQLEAITMREDTIRVDAGDENLDPAAYPDRAQNNGAAYEGE